MVLSTFSPRFMTNAGDGSKKWIAKTAGLVLQRLTTAEGIFGGLITTASVTALDHGYILPHEEILPERFESIAASLQEKRVLSEPILLGYPSHPKLGSILEAWINAHEPELVRTAKGITDEYWHIHDPSTTNKILEFFQEVEHFYLADGHHRLGAVKHLYEKGTLSRPDFLAACYSFKNLKIHAYHRSIRANREERAKIFGRLAEIGTLQKIEGFFDPRLATEVVVQSGHDWYRWSTPDLAQSAEDTTLLPALIFEDLVLSKACGIHDAKGSDRITYHPDNEQGKMIEWVKENHDQMGFYLSPVLPAQFMHFCKYGLMMPPKSTYFTPRMPRDAIYQFFDS